MSYEQKELSGALFKNSDKATDKQPDYTGSATIGGIKYALSAWIKKSKSGDSYMSLALQKKGDRTQRKEPDLESDHQRFYDDGRPSGDDIPF